MANLASSVPYTINGLLGKGWENVVFFGHFTWRDCFVSNSLMEFSICVSVSVGVDNQANPVPVRWTAYKRDRHTCTGNPGVSWEELICYINSLYFA